MIERVPSRILVAGAGGMLGRDLVDVARQHNIEVLALDRSALDVTDAIACLEAVAGMDVVLNAAAWTNVDAAEEHESEAFAINAQGAENLALAARAADAVLVQYSTDYVFSGEGNGPWPEAESVRPINAYGRTKAEGESRAMAAHPDGTIILRTAWLYGEFGSNFVSTMARLYREHGVLTVVDDQSGQPTWTRDLAEQTIKTLAAGARRGILHGTNSGSTTWWGFARAIVENLGGDPNLVHRTSSAAFSRPAKRPTNSVLGHDGWHEIGLTPLRHWRDALDEAMSTGKVN